ncbi:MAG: hypothetical protein JW951_09350 [Lentisphaerae bacterium]|nr:hypothetical protein [Lentisphaerota bacterium]
MNLRERIEAVYRGEMPDVVPYMLDLSHWFYHKHRAPWDLSVAYEKPETELIACHRQAGAGFYMPNLATFYRVSYPASVQTSMVKSADGQSITWGLATASGRIERTRIWEEASYSWGIRDWGIQAEQGLRVLAEALEDRTFAFLPDHYRAWIDTIGDDGVCYVGTGYSGLGQLLNYWMGIEGTMYGMMDWPETMRDTVERINANTLKLIDVLAASPAQYIVMGDNFSSDIQPPHLFNAWSRDFYTEAVRRLHAAGKYVAVHIDGRLGGAIRMIRETGADAGDAITPTPMGDLTPARCRDEAGPDFILSGGVSPDLWLPEVPLGVFEAKVREWLALKSRSPRLIANAGDQVPPGADEDRIRIMRDMVDGEGRY